MPAAPKIADALGNIWKIKVFRQAKTDHHSQTNCHIGISGKVKENLQGIGDERQPCKLRFNIGCREIKYSIGQERQLICN